MPTPRPTTELYAFRPPVVKDGRLALPVMSGLGQWSTLEASISSWRGVAEGILAATASPRRADGAPMRKPGGKLL